METGDLYRKLQKHLDHMPVGFPATQSGVELRILQRLFTPDEAALTLELSAIPEPAAAIRRRITPRPPIAELTARLDAMAAKGVILSLPSRSGPTRYAKMIFAVGFYERQVQRLTPEFERDALAYSQEAFGEAFHRRKTTQMRIVPVNQAIPDKRSIATYDDIRAYVEASPGPFAQMPCICRKGRDLIGEPCRATRERNNCLTIGQGAKQMIKAGAATFISKEQMLALLDEADREGLVLEAENTKNPVYICCCCGCCCGVLTSAKRLPKPAAYFSSNYYADVNPEACNSCGACEIRCQMEAIHPADNAVAIDLDRCIGCALCITSCPTEALQLKSKDAARVPPADTTGLYLNLMKDRYGAWGMAKIAARKVLGLKV